MNENSFGELLKALRQKNNLKQSELADILNVSADTVSKWELNKAYPNWNTQDAICEYFHLSHDDLHHPEAAIARLNQLVPPVEDAVSPETDVCFLNTDSTPIISLPHTSFKRKRKIIYGTILGVILLSLLAGIFFLLNKKANNTLPDSAQLSKELPFYYQSSRYNYDENIGSDVYERSCVYSGTFSTESVRAFEKALTKEWSQNNKVRKDIKTLKLSFYSNPQDAASFNPTEKVLYFFR